MKKLSPLYRENIDFFDSTLRVSENFDVIKKIVKIGSDELVFFISTGLSRTRSSAS